MMARTKLLLAALGCSALLTSDVRPSESLRPLRVLYIGHRPAEFAPFLKGHFARVESTPRESFQRQSANDFDVVLLATGRAMLVNAIAYISRFTEDRPIDVTPSVFGSEPVATTRRRAGYFTDKAKFPDYRMEWLTNVFPTSALKSFNWRDRDGATVWFGIVLSDVASQDFGRNQDYEIV